MCSEKKRFVSKIMVASKILKSQSNQQITTWKTNRDGKTHDMLALSLGKTWEVAKIIERESWLEL